MKYIPVVPSSLLDFAGDDFNALAKNFSDFALKLGVVVEVYEVDDENNRSKSLPEYDVMCFVQHKDMGVASTVYSNCIAMSGFGGIGDFTEFKLRKPKNNPKKSQNPQAENGSAVLLLCLDGDQDRGIIIGSLQHLKRETTLTKENEHHLEGEFNGLNWQVNKDGALTITFNSATDNDGKPKDEEAGGTTLSVEKDGSVQVSDGNKEYIRIDKTEKKISMEAETDISVVAGANISAKAEADVNVESGGALAAKAGGVANFESTGSFTVKAGGAMMIEAPELQIQANAGITAKGQQVFVDSPIINLGKGGTPAVTLSTLFLGIGNIGSPVISQAIGPFSSTVFVGL